MREVINFHYSNEELEILQYLLDECWSKEGNPLKGFRDYAEYWDVNFYYLEDKDVVSLSNEGLRTFCTITEFGEREINRLLEKGVLDDNYRSIKKIEL